MSKPWLLILRGATTPAWSDGEADVRGQVFDKWMRIHDQWTELGVRLVGTLDDVMAMCGVPGLRLWNFYEIYEIPNAEVVKTMLDMMRDAGPEKLRVDRFFRYEAVMGPRVTSVEDRIGGK